jgi:hypothetical protein
LYRRLGGPQGRSGRVRKISPPPGFDPQTVQPVASRCTDWATRLSTGSCRKSSVCFLLQFFIPHLRFIVSIGAIFDIRLGVLHATGNSRDPLAGPPHNMAWATIISYLFKLWILRSWYNKTGAFVLCGRLLFLFHEDHKLFVFYVRVKICLSSNIIEMLWVRVKKVCHPEGTISIDTVRRLLGPKKHK